MIRFRVDDYPGTKPEEFYRHNLENFKKFHEVMTRYGCVYVLGVIPVHTKIEDLEWLGQQPNIEIALHGVNHDERFPNEFRDYQARGDRMILLHNVKGLLELVTKKRVNIYIPPHNVLDNKTVLALKDVGFQEIFVGPETDAAVIAFAVEQGFNVIRHAPPHLYGRSDELLERGIVQFFRDLDRAKIDGNLGLHWTWEMNIGLESLERMLCLLAEETLI